MQKDCVHFCYLIYFFFLIIVFINSVLYLLVYLCVCFPVGVFFFFLLIGRAGEVKNSLQ